MRLLQANSHDTVVRLPYEFITDRYLTHPSQQLAFTQTATVFEDIVIRCVRYAFANIPAKVGRVFFGKHVALPFTRWRMLRHGYIRSPVHYREYSIGRVCLLFLASGVWSLAVRLIGGRGMLRRKVPGLCIIQSILPIVFFIISMVGCGNHTTRPHVTLTITRWRIPDGFELLLP